MNNLKSKAGFTLVELIVVIAILAILAGVGTAAYTGYIKKANEAADVSACDAIKTAVFAAYTANSQVPPTKIVITDDATDSIQVGDDDDVAAIPADYQDEFKLFLTGSDSGTLSVSLKKGNTATWTQSAGWAISGTVYTPAG